MAHKFKQHYTREEARALLPRIKSWLADLERLREELAKHEQKLVSLMSEGKDHGGGVVNQNVRTIADVQTVLREFRSREILLKDVERGLIDFPAVIGGREVFLCWEKDEDDIEFWHDIDTGYAGRERL